MTNAAICFKAIFLLFFSLLIGACQQVSPSSSVETETTNDEGPLYSLMRYGDQYFTTSDWYILNASEIPSRNVFSASWTNGSAIVQISDIVSISSPTFSIDNAASAFYEGGFDTVNAQNSCERNGVQLFLFDLVDQNQSYEGNYWRYRFDSTQVRHVSFVFPLGDEDAMSEYAQLMFPDLSTCED